MFGHPRIIRIALLAALGGCTAMGSGGGTGETPSGTNELGGKGDYIARCDSTSDPMLRCYGQSQFHSIAPVWDFLPLRTLETATDKDTTGTERSVVESDIFRHDEARNLLFVLNAYRGLQVIDVANADQPELVGHVALGGYPIEMYQEGDHAFVLLNSFSPFEQDGFTYGAVLRVFDTSDPTSPVQVGNDFPLAGNLVGSRLLPARNESGELVSAVIYVASQVYSRAPEEDGATWRPYSYVRSIDVTNPSMPVEADVLEFEGNGNALHVTPDAIFVASTQWSFESRPSTTIRYVDISSLEGAIALGGEIAVEGTIDWGERGELQMDHFRGHLRVASQLSGMNPDTMTWETSIRMTTISTADPAAMQVVDTFEFAPMHRILATRFEGDLAYLFHAVNVDPLEIIDLRDPRNIRSLGTLAINGFVNRIDVRGDKLIALGNMTDGTAGARRLALYVFDVEDPTMPRELGSATVGESWPWTSAAHDLKSYRIVDDLGLVLLPVSESVTGEDGRWSYRQWLQLFSFDLEACDAGDRAACVQTRGEIDGHGEVRRAFPVEDRIVSFSDLELQVADVSDPDHPVLTNSLELAADITDFRVVNGYGVMVVGKGDWSNRTAELRIVDAARPDERAPLATLALSTPTGEVHMVGTSHILIVATDGYSGETIFTLIDLSSPTRPVVVGQRRTAELGYARWDRRIGPWFPAPAKSYAVAGNALVAFTWPREGEAEGGKLRVFSIFDATERTTIDLGAETIVGLDAVGTRMYVSSYEPVEGAEPPVETPVEGGTAEEGAEGATAASLLPGGRIAPWRPRNQVVAYRMRVIDVRNPRRPQVSGPFSVPGPFSGIMTHRDGRTVLFTTDTFVSEGTNATALDAMTLGRDRVTLDDVFGTPPGVDRVHFEANRAFFVRNVYAWEGPVPLDGDERLLAPMPRASLVALTIAQNNVRSTRGAYHGSVTIRRLGEEDLGTGQFTELNLVRDDLAFIRSGYGQVLVYDVTHPRSGMELLVSSPTSAGWWSGAMHFDGSRLFLANGLYGLDVIEIPER